MKKSVLAGMIVTAAGLISSFGQGTIHFDSYHANNSNGIQIDWGYNIYGIPFGTPVSTSPERPMTASLLYSLTPITDNAGFGPLSPGWIDANDTAPIENGYFIGNNFVLPDYIPGSLVYFIVLAYSGNNYASSPARAHSNAFSETLATGTDLPGYIDNMQPFIIEQIPEPSTLALCGLGLVAWVGCRAKSFFPGETA